MATSFLRSDTLFDQELSFEKEINNNTNDPLSIEILDEIETELDHLFGDEINDIEFSDNTDVSIDFLKEVVEKIKTEFDGILEDPNKKRYLEVFSRIFARLSTLKVDNFEKIANIIIISLSKVVKYGQNKISSKKIKMLATERKIYSI